MAILCRRQGHDTELLERFAAPAPIGSGLLLQPTGLAVLKALGLDNSVMQTGHRIDRIHGRAMPSGRSVLDVRYDSLGADMYSVAVHRAALFDALHALALAENVTVRCGVDAVSVSAVGAQRFVIGDSGARFGPFDLVVDASGAGSKVCRALYPKLRRRELAFGALWGSFTWSRDVFPEHSLTQRYVRAHTMIGVLPLGRRQSVAEDEVAFFWSLRRDQLDAWRAAGLAPWKAQVRTIWPETEAVLEQIADPAQLTFATYGHHTLRQPYADGVAFIGDAAHATSPQLGQGVNMALLDAFALSCALQESEDVQQVLRCYAASRRWHIRLFQFASLALTGCYQSDSRALAGLRDYLLAPVLRLPGLRRFAAQLVAGLVGRPLASAGLRRGKSRKGDSPGA